MSELIVFLSVAASTSGAAVVAAALITYVRQIVPMPNRVAWRRGSRWQRLGWTLVHAPAYGRVWGLLLPIAISLLASWALHALGVDVRPTLDALMAAVMTQMLHGFNLSDDLAEKIASNELRSISARRRADITRPAAKK